MNAQDLMKSVLQLAIQGKLVEQRNDEGTAEELYQQIKEEKAKLIKEGKIKKEKPRRVVTEDEISFEIPENWKWVRVGEIFQINPRNNLKDDVSVSFIPMTLLEAGYQNKFSYEVKKWGEVKNGFTHFKDSDIVIAKITPCFQNLKSAIMKDLKNGFGAGTTELHVFRPYNNLCLEYFMWFIKSPVFISNCVANMTGTAGQQRVGKEFIANHLVPLPPLEEQKRIVTKIEELIPYVKKYGEAHTKLEVFNKKFPEDMQKSILQYAIQGKLVEQRDEEGTAEALYQQIKEEKAKLIKEGKIKKEKPLPAITEDEIPFEIPESWKWVSIGQVCSNIMYGTSKKSSIKGKIPVLRMGNLQGGIVDYSNLVYSSDDEEIKKYQLEKNDLLFNRTNSRELVGKTAIYKGELPAIFAGYLVRISPVLVCSDYINFVMQSNYYWRYCQSVRSDAIGQSNINAEKLKCFLIPLPPLEEQKRIVTKIEELMPFCQQLVK